MQKPVPSDEGGLEEIRRQAKEAREALDAFDATVEAFLRASESRVDFFGMAAAGSATFVFEMRKGRNFRRNRLKRVLAFIENFEGNEGLRRRSAGRGGAPESDAALVGAKRSGAIRER
ncbi:hypothetical protein [Bosea sp. MMO-172]|uniref:hypothetical protein n=1 Tax=Bosea sp. MMO-172 TaxID=3127885 RepID=UPI003016E0C5